MKAFKCSVCGERVEGNFDKGAELTCCYCVNEMLWDPVEFKGVFLDVLDEYSLEIKKRSKPLCEDGDFTGFWRPVVREVERRCDEEGIDFYSARTSMKNIHRRYDLIQRKEVKNGTSKKENIRSEQRRTSYGRRIEQTA